MPPTSTSPVHMHSGLLGQDTTLFLQTQGYIMPETQYSIFNKLKHKAHTKRESSHNSRTTIIWAAHLWTGPMPLLAMQ